MIIVLSIIGIISAVLLAYVYQWTLPYINKHQQKKEKEAVFAVLPEADDYQKVKKSGLTFYEGYNQSGSRIGVAMKITGGGFQGKITLMVGTDPERKKIYGIEVIDHMETPGLGANITGREFKSNFNNKPFGDYKVIKRPADTSLEVEAISGATISSTKVTNIVETAFKKVQKAYGGGN